MEDTVLFSLMAHKPFRVLQCSSSFGRNRFELSLFISNYLLILAYCVSYENKQMGSNTQL